MKEFPTRLNRKRKSAAIRPRSTAYIGSAKIVGPQTFGVVIQVRNNSECNRAFRYVCQKFGITPKLVDVQRNAFEVFALPEVLSGMMNAKYCVSMEQRTNQAIPRGAAGASSEEQAANARRKPAIQKRAIVREMFREEFRAGAERVESFREIVDGGFPAIRAVAIVKGV